MTHVLDATPSLASIIAAAKQRDHAAFERLHDHYVTSLHRYIYARCGDAQLAEELLGELWLRVVERIGAFRLPDQGAETAFTAWLYQIARNLVIDHYRRSKRAHVPLEESVQSRLPAVEEQIEDREARQALHEAIGQLTADQREVLLLRFFEGRSSAEVAHLTGRNEGAVKTMQRRAVAALARLLGRYQHAER